MNKYSKIKSINHPISVSALTESDIYRLSSRNVNRVDPDKITRATGPENPNVLKAGGWWAWMRMVQNIKS